MKTIDKIIDGFFEIFFSKDKTKLYLLIFLILGLILRIIAAINLSVSADDMHFTVHAIDFIKSGKLATFDQPPLWYFFTDFFYKIFGVNQFGSRFASVLFGSLSIILMYLFCNKVFKSKKIGLIAVFLLAISPLHIKLSIAEMDNMAMFFVLLSFFYIEEYLNNKKTGFFVLSAASMGVALLTKQYAILFLPGIFLYLLYRNYKQEKKIIDTRIIKKYALFALILFLFIMPVLTHNYLLYTDKGFLDFQFNRVLKFGAETAKDYYSGFAGFDAKIDLRGFVFGNSVHHRTGTPSALRAFSFLAFEDWIVTIFGLIGLFVLLSRKHYYIPVFLAMFIIPFVYLGSIALMSKHFIFALLAFIPFAAFSINGLHEKSRGKIKLRYIFILIFIVSLINLGFNNTTIGNFYSKSGIAGMIGEKVNIPDDALVAVDGRIYRGQVNWMFYGKNYIEASYLPDLFKMSDESSGQKIPIMVYFIECELDDCGWGTIVNQPEFNRTMESMAGFFKNGTEISKTIYSSENSPYYFPILSEKKAHFNIYMRTLPLNPGILDVVKKTHVWFLYPVGYDKIISEIFDDYSLHSTFDWFLENASLLIIKISFIIGFIFGILVIYYTFKND